MTAIKGKYNGKTVTFDRVLPIHECEVIVTFPDSPSFEESIDDGSLTYLFKDYVDDSIREPILDFGKAIGNEQW